MSLIGRTLAGRFAVTGLIGEGGFATVYRGVQVLPHEQRDVAIKVMREALARDRRFVRRFRREGKASAALEHPNVVRVLESGVDDGVAYIAMELLVGEDLFSRLSRERRLTETHAARIVMEVCEALDAAHALGIVHRDLKPENVMLVPDATAPGGQRVKVLDFGVAKLLDPGVGRPPADESPSSTHTALTRAGTVMGTPAYMSPEQGRAEPIDARSDLYACGVLLYQLLTGRVPFDGETALQIVMQHVRDAPRPPSEIVPTLHPRLEAVILRALAKFPADRHQTAAELEADLARLLPQLATTRHAVATLAPAPTNETISHLDTQLVMTPADPDSSERTLVREPRSGGGQAPSAPLWTLSSAPTPALVEAPRILETPRMVEAPPPKQGLRGRVPPEALSTLKSAPSDQTPIRPAQPWVVIVPPAPLDTPRPSPAAARPPDGVEAPGATPPYVIVMVVAAAALVIIAIAVAVAFVMA